VEFWVMFHSPRFTEMAIYEKNRDFNRRGGVWAIKGDHLFERRKTANIGPASFKDDREGWRDDQKKAGGEKGGGCGTQAPGNGITFFCRLKGESQTELALISKSRSTIGSEMGIRKELLKLGATHYVMNDHVGQQRGSSRRMDPRGEVTNASEGGSQVATKKVWSTDY